MQILIKARVISVTEVIDFYSQIKDRDIEEVLDETIKELAIVYLEPRIVREQELEQRIIKESERFHAEEPYITI